MLILSRRPDEAVNCSIDVEGLRALLNRAESGQPIEFRILVVRSAQGKSVRLGLDFPEEVKLVRDDANEPI